VKQVQEWLGHATPTITLETYIHLMDDGIGEPLEIDRDADSEAEREEAEASAV
jgi:integrase